MFVSLALYQQNRGWNDFVRVAENWPFIHTYKLYKVHINNNFAYITAFLSQIKTWKMQNFCVSQYSWYNELQNKVISSVPLIPAFLFKVAVNNKVSKYRLIFFKSYVKYSGKWWLLFHSQTCFCSLATFMLHWFQHIYPLLTVMWEKICCL